jgi:hypothetical protein
MKERHVTAENLVIHYRLTRALYAKSTPFYELDQIWTLLRYFEVE